MKIDRERFRRCFEDYTRAFDPRDTKVFLKMQHTYRVADLCDTIAGELNMSEADRDLAWAIGMLHDIGRFEQVRKYGTFNDAISVNHAMFGADLLFKEGLIDNFPLSEASETDPDGLKRLIEVAIRQHNRLNIEEGISDRERTFCQIIRDADKIDIFRVNMEIPVTSIYDLPLEVFMDSEISEGVMKTFCSRRCIDKKIRQTPADMIVSHIALAFELVFPISRRLADQQGYLWQMFEFPFSNPDTLEKVEFMKEMMVSFLRV